MVAMKDIVKARYEDFGTAGNASKIKPISLEAMAGHYAWCGRGLMTRLEKGRF